MSPSRTVAAAAGIVATVLGIAIAISPALTQLIAVPTIPVTALGALSVVIASLVALRRRDSTVRGADPPDVEELVEHPRPGDAFDGALHDARGIGVDAARNRREAREHLADVAVSILVLVDGYTESEADEALAAGTWTDDPVAAACFAATPPSVGLVGALSQYVDRRSRYERELTHAIEALESRVSGEDKR